MRGAGPAEKVVLGPVSEALRLKALAGTLKFF